jgi:hypothetical protein
VLEAACRKRVEDELAGLPDESLVAAVARCPPTRRRVGRRPTGVRCATLFEASYVGDQVVDRRTLL